MNIAYVRVSTQEQNESRQMVSLERFNIDKWFIEKVSASTADRPKLQTLLEFARAGDTVYVHDFSRLARNTADLLHIIEMLNAKEVCLISATENLDTGSATGKLMLTMLAAVNEFERNILLERQREGIEQAKLRGVYHGRTKMKPPKGFADLVQKIESGSITKTDAAAALGISRTTLRHMISEFQQPISYPDEFVELYGEYMSGNINLPEMVVTLDLSRREVERMIRGYTEMLKDEGEQE